MLDIPDENPINYVALASMPVFDGLCSMDVTDEVAALRAERDDAIALLERGERDLYAATLKDSVEVYERWRQDVRRMLAAYRAAQQETTDAN